MILLVFTSRRQRHLVKQILSIYRWALSSQLQLCKSHPDSACHSHRSREVVLHYLSTVELASYLSQRKAAEEQERAAVIGDQFLKILFH